MDIGWKEVFWDIHLIFFFPFNILKLERAQLGVMTLPTRDQASGRRATTEFPTTRVSLCLIDNNVLETEEEDEPPKSPKAAPSFLLPCISV